VARKSALLDLAAVELYEDALEEVLPGSRDNWIRIIGELRWQCIKASPKDEDTSLVCLQTCLSRDDLDHARQVFCLAVISVHLLDYKLISIIKIANSLEKNFPSNHSYIFWNITSMFLFSVGILFDRGDVYEF
jgi:N-terminal acetyltransferase B complex non-catalytic subunit